jgi:uncharacterized membrane protein YjfL (UPF0719 family)
MTHAIVLLQSTVYTLVVLAYWFIAKKVIDWITVYDDDHEIEEKKNLAIGLMRSGLYLGIAIGMAGALSGNGSEHDFWKDVQTLLLDGVLITPLLIISRYINDKFILYGVNNDVEIGKGNVAVGIAEFGSLIGAGFLLSGSFSGEGKVLSSIPFFILGQVAFVVVNVLIEKVGGYKARQQAEQGNISAGIFLASKFISLGLILRASIAGPSEGWANDLVSFSATLVIGLIILLLFNRIGDWIFLPNSEDKDQIDTRRNPAALMLAAGIEVGLAIVVSSVI